MVVLALVGAEAAVERDPRTALPPIAWRAASFAGAPVSCAIPDIAPAPTAEREEDDRESERCVGGSDWARNDGKEDGRHERLECERMRDASATDEPSRELSFARFSSSRRW